MRAEELLERKEFLTQEEIDRAASLLVAPLAQNFRAAMEWIARSKSEPVAVDYIHRIATDKKFKSVAKRQQFLSLLTARIVSHLNNLFTIGDSNKVKYATEYAVKFAALVGSHDVAAYVDVIAKNLTTIETALYDIMHDTMGDKTIGASRQYDDVTDILKSMKRLGFSDIELKIRSKYKSERIMKTPPTKRSTWEYYELYDVLDNMASGRDTVVNRLEHLSSEAQNRILELKDYFLYREGSIYITDGRMTEFVKTIINVKYPEMKRFGLPWPELDFKYNSTADMLEFYKKPIIKMLLKSLKGENKINIPMTVANLRKSGVDWPELERIEAVTTRQAIVESRDINQMSEEEQIRAVNRDARRIQHVNNPSERVQLAAVQQDGNSIRYIENPSERVQLAAVSEDGGTIYYIQNPSEPVQLAAVRRWAWAIESIENPSEKTQIAAVQYIDLLILHIPNPSERVQIAAVKQKGRAIEYIRNPSPKLFTDPEVKTAVIRRLLISLKSGVFINHILEYLDKHQVDWPELDKIEAVTTRKSITKSRK